MVGADNLIVVRGGGDIATGVITSLKISGFNVLVLEVKRPTSIRRKVSFSEAIYEKEWMVEGLKSVKVEGIREIHGVIKNGDIPIMVDPDMKILEELNPLAIIDSTISKRNLGMSKDLAPITIAIGPGYYAGKDVDYVIESSRGHNLGKIIYEGEAEKDTGIPGKIRGWTDERVLRSPRDGFIVNKKRIGDRVKKKELICEVDGSPVYSELSGVLRGILKNGLEVKKGQKIGDVDPRGKREYAWTISDKARVIGAGVLLAILENIEKVK